ncbi:Nn.00g006420.m01.CDS01 [Neocucurbitaria sp. VM-36]
MYLQKRDNMGFQIAPALIIFLVILGAGGLVCCGFAIYRFHSGDVEDTSRWNNRSPEQDAYMREVRERNWGKVQRIGVRNLYGPPRGDLAHAPMSPSANSNTTYG